MNKLLVVSFFAALTLLLHTIIFSLLDTSEFFIMIHCFIALSLVISVNLIAILKNGRST